MTKRIPGIPTMYKGIRFRSRLEAKWAAFFDLMCWEWEYEPFDLNGWIPDFTIHVESERPRVLVEVKPFDRFKIPDFALAMDKATQALVGTHCSESTILFTGSSLRRVTLENGCVALSAGVASSHMEVSGVEFRSSSEALFAWPDDPSETDLIHSIGGPALLSGFLVSKDRKRCACPKLSRDSIHEIDAAWASACNNVQWKGRGG